MPRLARDPRARLRMELAHWDGREARGTQKKAVSVSWGGGAGGKGTLERQRVSERKGHREGGHISPGQCRTLHRTCLPLPPCAPTQEAD